MSQESYVLFLSLYLREWGSFTKNNIASGTLVRYNIHLIVRIVHCLKTLHENSSTSIVSGIVETPHFEEP